jgi:hypothetical protein
MTNSRKSQSKKLKTNRGRENAAKTHPVPTLHARREPAPHRARARDRASSEESSERCSAALAELLGRRGRPEGVLDGAELGGIRFKACEVVKEAQSRGVERTGGGSDHWHEPTVLGLKTPVVLGRLGAIGPL